MALENSIDKFELAIKKIGLWLGLVLSIGAIYGAGPFPFLDQGIRLGGAIGAGVIIILTSKPLAQQLGVSSNKSRLFFWV